MKYLTLLSAALIILGCTDERSTVIADYVQTNGNIKTDMSFSLKTIEDLGEVYGRDSLAIATPLFGEMKSRVINNSFSRIETYKTLCASTSRSIQDYKTNAIWKRVYGADLKTKIAEEEASLAKYQATLKSEVDFVSKIQNDSIPWIDEVEKLDVGRAYNQIKKYEANPDIVLAHKTKVTYSIINPLLNNAKQEVTKTFAFSPDNKKILSVIE